MPFAVAAAAIGAGGALLAGSEQAGAAKKAAQTSADAQNNAVATQLQMYNQTRSDLSPYTQAGYGGLSQLSQFLSPGGPLSSLLGLGPQGSAGMNSQLQNYPGYQFALQQGQQAQDRSAASRGMLLSGGQLKDAQTYGQGMASQLYGTYLGQLGQYGSQLSGLAGLGENAAAQTGNAGTAAGGQIGSSLLTGASQQSSALQNAGTANSSGIAGASNNFGTLLTNANFQSLFNSPSSSGFNVANDNNGSGEFYGLSA